MIADRSVAPRSGAYRLVAGLAAWGLSAFLIVRSLDTDRIIRFGDFRLTFYPAAQSLLTPQGPYGPSFAGTALGQTSHNLYLGPIVPLLMHPLAHFDPVIAGELWLAINLGLLVATAVLVTIGLPHSHGGLFASGLVFLVLATFAPIREALLTNNLDIAVGAMVAGALVFWRRKSPSGRFKQNRVLVGVLLGLATAIKIYPVALLAYAAWKRQYTLAFSGVATIAAAIAAPVLVVGPRVLGDYARMLQIGATSQHASSPLVFGLSGAAGRLLTANPFAQPLVTLPTSLVRTALAVLYVAVLGAVAMSLPRAGRHGLALERAVVVAGGLAAFPPLEVWHLGMLAIVLPAAGLDLQRRQEMRSLRRGDWWMLGLLVLGIPLVLQLLAPYLPARLTVELQLLLPLVGAISFFVFASETAVRRLDLGLLAAIAATYALISGPALVNAPSWWGPYKSLLHNVASDVALAALVVLAACIAVLRARMSTSMSATKATAISG